MEKYKTELCKRWDTLGYCEYRWKCMFAHGEHELRAKPVGKLYKTKVCKAWVEEGVCQYGTRCTFIHPTTPSLHLNPTKSS
jgi:hypothetical protein